MRRSGRRGFWHHICQIVSGGRWTFQGVLESSMNCDPAVLKEVLAERAKGETGP